MPVGEAVQVQAVGVEEPQAGRFVAGFDGADEVPPRRQRRMRRLGFGDAACVGAARPAAGGEDPREERVVAAAEVAEAEGVGKLPAVLLRVVSQNQAIL